MLLLVAICGLTGCLSRPALTRQSFSFSLPPVAVTNVVKHDFVLGMRSLQIAAPFDGRSLIFRTGEFTYERDPYAEFLESPADELMPAVREWFSTTGDFRAVTEAGSALKPDMLVEINVSQMYGDFRQPKHPAAIMAVQFVFFDSAKGVPGNAVFQKKCSRQIPLRAPTAAALMAGWDQAISEILAEISADLRFPNAKK